MLRAALLNGSIQFRGWSILGWENLEGYGYLAQRKEESSVPILQLGFISGGKRGAHFRIRTTAPAYGVTTASLTLLTKLPLCRAMSLHLGPAVHDERSGVGADSRVQKKWDFTPSPGLARWFRPWNGPKQIHLISLTHTKPESSPVVSTITTISA